MPAASGWQRPSPVVHLQGKEVLMLKKEDPGFKLLLLLKNPNES